MPKQISEGAHAQATDRGPAETKIRTLALQTALAADRVLPEGECDRIVALACGQLTPEQLRTGQIGADIFARVAEMTQRALELGPVNHISASKVQVEARAKQNGAEGRFVNGQWAGTSKLATGDSSKAGYQSLAGNDTRSLQAVTAQNFGSSAFAAAGVDYGTFAFLRAHGSFTAQNILTAANDTKALGFKPTDRGAMLDHATIEKFDPKARQTNAALQDYQKRIEGDAELSELHHERRSAKTSEARKAVDAKIAERRARHADESGLNGRVTDPQAHPKAVKATTRRKTAVETKAEALYAPKQGVTPTGAAAKTKPKTDLFKQLTGP